MAKDKSERSKDSPTSLRILYVEDNPADAELVLLRLKKAGIELRAAVVDTQEAFQEKLQSDPYDVILSDYNLRDWSGMDALQITQKEAPETPFILVTGTLGEEAAVDCIKAGVTDFVLKDRLARLPSSILRALQEKATREEKRRAIEARRKAEAEYRLLFDGNPHPMWVYDLETLEFIAVNEAAIAHYGYSRNEFLAMTIKDIRPPDDLPAPLEHIAQPKADGCRGEIWKHRKKDGSIIDVEVTSQPILFWGRRTELVLVNDFTKRKCAEEELVKLRKAVDTSGEVIFMTDRDGVFTFVNPEFTRLYGYTAEEVVGKTTPRVLKSGRKSPKEYATFWKTVLEKRVVKGEWVNKTRDGRLVTIDESANPILDEHGEIKGFLAIQRDITERERAAEILGASELRYRRLFEAAKDGILILDGHTGEIIDVNPFLMNLVGYSRQEFLGKRLWEIGSFKGNLNSLESFRVLQKNEYITYDDLPLETKDGKRVDVEFVSNAYLSGEKKVIQCNIRDMTERRHLELQLRQSQKMEAIGQLAGGVAHDFNNLLTIISGYSELVADSLGPDSPQLGQVKEIQKAADRAAGLTRQLLAFGRRQVLSLQVLDLNGVVSNVDKMLRRLIGEDIDLVSIPGGKLGRVKADAGQIEQIIMNLAVNARDAMPKGGKLTIETADVVLDDVYARKHVVITPGPYVMLAVSDTGCGMDEATQAHAFEPFFTTKAQGKGTGLGLATVYGIVKQSGGNIWMYSELGKGTTFKVYLPRVDDLVAQMKLSHNVEGDCRGTETVLVVEDEETIRSLVRGILETRGYTVLEANCGVDGLSICQKYPHTIHLLLSDVVMPQMSGPELAANLATLRPATNVLFMSGYTNNAISHEGLLDGKTAFIEKPFTPQALARKVREVLDGPAERSVEAAA